MKAPKLIIAILISSIPGFIGAYFSSDSIHGWYATLAIPTLNPPSWIFGPVWTILYILMGISVYLIWKKGPKKKEVRAALLIFVAQLINNALWSVLFFGLQRPFAAFVEILALWILILLTIVTFSKISKTAALLLVPYLLWVSFAAYLNYVICMLN